LLRSELKRNVLLLEQMDRPVLERVAVQVDLVVLRVQWRVVVKEEMVTLLPFQTMLVMVVQAELVEVPLVPPAV